MRRAKPTVTAAIAATAIVWLIDSAVAGVKVTVEFDKSFNFAAVRTWGWNPQGAGDVKMARTEEDDPVAMRKQVEPLIVEAVTTELTSRGLQIASSAPDLSVTYYLLLTTNVSAQTLGQFLPATTAWGLPPYSAATQSFEIMNQGSLVLDLSVAGNVIWRGVAQAKVKLDTDKKRREALLREAVHDLLRRYPKK